MSTIKKYNKHIPALSGLVLAGGKSKRMGIDKSQIKYHSDPQEIHMAKLLSETGLKTFISKDSCTHGKIQSFDVINDSFTNMGPLGAILSAFKHEPNNAYLVVACDLPLIDKSLIQKLINCRNPNKIATAIKDSSTLFPEPLVTIYEPKSYKRILNCLEMGFSSPRKILMNSDIATVEINENEKISNANTREERELLKRKLEENA